MKLFKNNYIIISIITLTIFTSYSYFEPSDHQYNGIIIPFLWTIIMLFFQYKKNLILSINSYFIFMLMLLSDKLNFGIIPSQNVMAYSFLAITLSFIFLLLYKLLKYPKIATTISSIISFFIYLLPLVIIIYILNFAVKINESTLFAVYQSNFNESMAYIIEFIPIEFLLVFVLIPILIGFLFNKQKKHEEETVHDTSFLILIIIVLIMLLPSYKSDLRIFNFIVDGIEVYKKELKLFHEVQEKRKSGKIKFTSSKDKKGETYIVVIGESLNKHHMGIYGYFRNTTPHLSKMKKNGELIIFDSVYSSHTHTMPVLSYSLTEANQYNNKNYYDSLSIINILNKANIETYWLSNQVMYGAWDNLVSVIANESDNVFSLNSNVGKKFQTQSYDGSLIAKLNNILSKQSDKNRVIFVHLMGSHVAYNSRYPKDKFSKYNEKLNIGEFGTRFLKNPIINSYDNSVVYNDFIINSILNSLKNIKGRNGLIYFSDHADDVMSMLGHNSAQFTFNMTEIPMIMWFSDEYKEEYTSKYNTLYKRDLTLYSNDMMFDTMIGIFDIKTDRYNPLYDLSSVEYKLDSSKAVTLNGKYLYTDKRNYVYWQKNNTKFLLDINQSSRVFPHRVDSVGKLHDIWQDGFRSFELDTMFIDDKTKYFRVGHNKGVMGIKLSVFLSSVEYTKIERIWMDFKNLNINTSNDSLAALEKLDKKFHLKKKIIVESGTLNKTFKNFNKAGWHTSYYLPTQKIIKLLNMKNITKLKSLAEIISTQTKVQSVSAVSFDDRLYPFVKKYLEPLLSKDIMYHVWYAPSLFDNNFKNKLLKNSMYKDSRVKTLLSRYESKYNL